MDKTDSRTHEDPQKSKKTMKRSAHRTLESNTIADFSRSSGSCWIYVDIEGP